MSSNRQTRAVLLLSAVALAASLGACATPTPSGAPGVKASLTPTEQYTAQVTEHPEQILLAPHEDGLSPPQVAALSELVSHWRSAGVGPILIRTPSHGGGKTYRAAANIQSELAALGVVDGRISLSGYADEGDGAGAPIVVSFDRYEAKTTECGRSWDNITSTAANKPDANFGCAVTANLTAMISNPADLAHAQPLDPGDNARREIVLGKFRAGQVSSSAKDDQASGAISSVVH